jgi:muramoyltetrapeptide carboxypeptidase
MTTKPPALRRGDLVGVCAPSGPIEPGELGNGVRELESLGFRVRVPEGILARTRFTAGTVERRVVELHALFGDPEVRAVVCARGGAGAGGLLDRIDTGILAANPKPFVGYSDATAFHLLLARLGRVSVYGPMAGRGLHPGGYDRDSFLAAVCGEGSFFASGPDDLVSLREGEGEGVLRGGCLSLLAAAAGTPDAMRPDQEGTILFLEDVRERPFRIDRMLTQLRRSGAFAGVRGVVFGEMKGCAPEAEADYRLENVLLDALAGLEVPVALGLSAGHANHPIVSLPLGVRARLVCGEADARLEVLEAAVS